MWFWTRLPNINTNHCAINEESGFPRQGQIREKNNKGKPHHASISAFRGNWDCRVDEFRWILKQPETRQPSRASYFGARLRHVISRFGFSFRNWPKLVMWATELAKYSSVWRTDCNNLSPGFYHVYNACPMGISIYKLSKSYDRTECTEFTTGSMYKRQYCTHSCGRWLNTPDVCI